MVGFMQAVSRNNLCTTGEEQYKKYLEISQRDPSEVLNWERANLSKALNNRGIEGEDAEDALKYWASLPRAQSGSSDRSSAPGAVNQYLSTLKSLLKCTRDDTENSFLYASTWEGDIQISKAMPFVDRAKEIDILLKVLKSLFHWWKSVLQISSGQWDESYKGKGFSFTICGAASGIGKSTFARKAFVQMSHLITKQITAGTAPRDDPLIKLLLDCVERRALYRTTFVHITNWEISNPACSIAFRLLHAACKYMFLDKKMQFFPRFEESFPPPLDLKLHHVFSFVREVLGVPTKQPVMIVYHLDEMNHMQLESSHKQYTHDILAHMHASMIQSDVFLFPILTGTNAEELNRLKISSGFPISSINLGPLPIHYMRLVFAIVIRNLAQHVDKPIPEVIARFIKERLVKNKFSYQELEIVISDCGGNPQVLAILFGVLASAKEFEKVFAISDEQVEQLLKQIEEIDVPTTKTIRDAVWHSVVSSHILGSLVVRKELAEVICGFGLTGELVQRDTVLVNGVTVGNAESSGALYLLQEEGDINPTEQHFCVILPYIHYRSLQFRACCPSLSLLKHWTTNDRDNELHDIEYIAFRVWWLKHKTTASSFKLSELFPSLTFLPTQDVQLLFPSNFNITQMQMQTKDTYQEQILKYRTWYREMHFFLGPGKESFVDSWAVFNLASDPATPQSPGTFFSIMVQSRQTTVNGVTSDCEEQLKMCEDAAQSLFHLLVISDGIIEAHNSDKLHCVQGSDLDNFFGPVLGPLRRSTVELLAGVGDNAELTDEELMDEQELMVDD